MTKYVILTVEQVTALHDAIIGSKELQGLAKDKSLEAVLERVHNRLQYGFIADVYDLAACYATFIAKGHCFNDANKRTAATVAFFILTIHQIEINFSDVSLGQWIVDVANNKRSEVDLASWIRMQTN
jgi:death-on-curing protein